MFTYRCTWRQCSRKASWLLLTWGTVPRTVTSGWLVLCSPPCCAASKSAPVAQPSLLSDSNFSSKTPPPSKCQHNKFRSSFNFSVQFCQFAREFTAKCNEGSAWSKFGMKVTFTKRVSGSGTKSLRTCTEVFIYMFKVLLEKGYDSP